MAVLEKIREGTKIVAGKQLLAFCTYAEISLRVWGPKIFQQQLLIFLTLYFLGIQQKVINLEI